MVDVVFLEDGCDPPPNERYLVIEWRRTGSGCAVRHEAMGVRYVVGPDKHAFWSGEARHVARRLKFDRVYYKGYPDPSLVQSALRPAAKG